VIHFLLDEKNINDEKRAEKAFELAVEKSQQEGFNYVDPETGESCNKWLQQAEKLSMIAAEHDENYPEYEKLINFDIPEEIMNIR